MYVCVHTYMCACRVPFNTNTLAERAAAAASSLTALLMGCLLRLSNFFFSPFYTHTNRVSFLIVLICFPYVDLYILHVCLLQLVGVYSSRICDEPQKHTQTHMHIFYLIYTHTYRQHFENLEGGKRMRNRCNLLHYTCNTRVQHCFCYYMLALLCL